MTVPTLRPVQTHGNMPAVFSYQKEVRAMYEAHLARVRLFAGLAHRELTWLSEGCREREFASGAPLVRAGQSEASLFIVLRGHVAPIPRQADGSERPTDRFGPGTVIGERALCDGLPCEHTIAALEPCTVLVLPHRDFQATLRESPDIAIKLLAIISGRLRQAEQTPPHSSPDLYPSEDSDTPTSYESQEANS